MDDSHSAPATDQPSGPHVVVMECSGIVEQGIVALIRDRGMTAEESSGKLERVISACRKVPRAVLLVRDLPAGLSIGDLLREMRKAGLSNPVIHLVHAAGRDRVVRMIQQGVRGLVDQDDAPAQLFEAIRSVSADRDVWISPKVATALVPTGSDSRHDIGLTTRETEILALVAQGKSVDAIAAQLGIVRGTVRNCLSVIYQKLEVHTRAEAMVWAWKHGQI